ncbi:ribosome biogenesis factor YjgA [Maridesulfovibrio sp.]|uniref:ribosome biogenesis factor YjgA n=1 Tax=Maridesulfovibrio sp. TaxID=2795000 RepID=UPI0029C9C19A|nr:ribosome biogenesis factor YjgA [Maridesulfovibrio sp.]
MYDADDLYNDEEEYSGPSRSQKKRDMTALQNMAEKLMTLGPELVKKCGLPDYFIEEVLDAMAIKSHEAKRRKTQYIGKLIREVDPQPLIDFLEDIETGNKADNMKFHALEQWRTRLIEGDFSVLDEILEQHPQADRQRISQLARNARKEKEKSKPPKSARALFKTLRELSE